MRGSMISTWASMETDPILLIRDLQVFRGASPILQGVSLQVGATPSATISRGTGRHRLCTAGTSCLFVSLGA